MIQYVKGNILDSTAEYLVNPVNTVGVMGAGLALQFKNKYPYMFKEYKEICNTNQWFARGRGFRIVLAEEPKIHTIEQNDEIIETKTYTNKYIILFPTKRHWKDKSDLAMIDNNLEDLAQYFSEALLTSVVHSFNIAFPKLGCGCGRLNWEGQVKPLMERYLGGCRYVNAFIYE